MYWVIQDNLYNEEGHASLLRVLDVMGLPHSTHKIVPFMHTLEPEPVIPPGTKIIALGAYTMISIAKERGWDPGTYDLEHWAELHELRPYWGGRLLNADAWIGRLRDVPPFTQPHFIRPLRDSKVFSGKVIDWGEFTEWQQDLFGEHIDDNTQVLVAPRKPIFAEYRTWVVDGQVISASQYKQGRTVLYNSEVPPGILEFAQECVDLGPPLRAYVLDVAATPDGHRIVEINTINAAGWYKGNVGRIVAALESLQTQDVTP